MVGSRYRTLGAVVIACALVVAGTACGGGSSGSKSANSSSGKSTETTSGGSVQTESLDVNNCTLLTDAEVSTLGEQLHVGEDSALGCGWSPQGQSMADFSIRSFQSGSSVQAYGKKLAPDAQQIPLEGVGDEAVGLAADGNVNFLVARKGKLFVEMVMTFLDVAPGSDNLTRAEGLANKALGRLAKAVG